MNRKRQDMQTLEQAMDAWAVTDDLRRKGELLVRAEALAQRHIQAYRRWLTVAATAAADISRSLDSRAPIGVGARRAA
jgi:hypothetical protein